MLTARRRHSPRALFLTLSGRISREGEHHLETRSVLATLMLYVDQHDRQKIQITLADLVASTVV